MFDKTLCISYAKQWAYSFNPRYYNFSNLGGDCTNFISQCLFAGGIPMNYLKYGWYYSTLQSRAPAWTGVNEFWQFGTTNKSVGLKLAPVNQEETQVADIVQLSNGNVFYHTVLITKITEENGVRKIFVAAHDNAAFDKPLESYGAAYLRFARPFD